MKPRKKKPLESELVKGHIVPHLQGLGYTIIQKTHGNRYQKGFPDLYCFHPTNLEGPCSGSAPEHRWLEAKRPNGKLTPKQVALFTKWSEAGLEVEVVTVVEKLSGHVVEFSPWREWV